MVIRLIIIIINVTYTPRLLYADDVCLLASSEEDMKIVMEPAKECVIEYGLNVNEKKSKVVCINDKVGKRIWLKGDC